MSVATVAETKTGKRPQYKDYVSFLENYRNGKKEDQSSVVTSDSGVGFSLNNSSNNSSSSVYSDITDPPKNSFKEYLDSYNNKRYSSVQPPVQMKKQTERQNETRTVKTEVFIEINSAPNTVSKVVDISGAQNKSTVSKVSKIFEKNCANEQAVAKTVPPSGKVNTFNFEQKDADKPEQKNIPFRETTKKFVGSENRVTLKKSNSISEKSKVFEESSSRQEIKKTTVNGLPKVNRKDDTTTTKTNGCISPNPPVNNTKPVFVSKITTVPHDDAPKTNGTVSPKVNGIKPIIVPKAVAEALVFQQKEDQPSMKPPVAISKPPTPENLPIPPPPPFQNHPPVPSQNVPSGPCNVPPPPPPPPANFSVKKVINSPPKTTVTVQTNGVGPKKDVVDGAPVIDKNDPRVKRLVYGALREMYGAYHDKANDYIATLPRNRVKKNNGLDSIISSIA